MAKENALSDSGATENFMDQRMVERLGIGLRPMKEPQRVFNINGTENKHGTLIHYTLLWVKKRDKNLLQWFYVTSLEADHTIFGYPWLRDFNPNIDWGTSHVLGPPVWIETGLFQTTKQATMEWITKMVRDQPEWEEGDSIIATAHTLGQHAAQEWAIEANRNKADHVLPERYQRHARVFSEEGAKRFPLAQPDDMVVKLKPGTPDTINTKIYLLSHLEMEEWRGFVAKNKELEHIMETNSPYAAPVFLIHKKDGSFRLVQDYHKVNKHTIHNVYPMPCIEQILKQSHGKTIFTALNIRNGYNNICIHPEDWWKLAFKGPDEAYEPSIMFFGMSNAPAVFQRAIDWIFAKIKNKYPGCLFVYMDDNEVLHKQIVHAVLDLIDQENFFLKLNKCLFHQQSIDYLGIQIEGGRICINPTKIDGLANWKEELKDVHEVCFTLDCFGYNRPFVEGYAEIAWPLTRLTKKDIPFEWTPECTEAVQRLKKAITAELVLRQPDHNKSFTMEVDMFQFALGVILSQRDEQGKLCPMGYYLKTLIPAEGNYNIYDWELLALVQALQHWWHLLLGTEHLIEVFMDHDNLTKCKAP